MDSIATARDFFINQQGLSPDQADTIIGQGLQAYNQQTQPRSMMQMASGGIARLGYQLGGISTMPMDYGQPLQVPQQQQPMFTTTGSATSSPLLNYGQTRLNQAGGTSLSRPGYQEGGLTEFYKAEEPIIPRIENIGGLLDQAEKSIGEPANNMASPLATTFSRFGYEAGGVTIPSQGSEMEQLNQMDPAQAVEIITKLLIENGVPPEQAQQLALQIIQIFAQGGEPAVEAFADQLEQEEVQAMAGGGIAGYAYRQGYGFGGIGKAIGSVFKGAAKAVSGVVKGVAKAVKSVVKSDIGKLALLAGGAYLMMNPGILSGLGAGTAAGAGTTALETAALTEAGLGGLGTSLTAGTGSLVMPTAASVGTALPATAGGLTTAGSLALPAATSITADALAAATPSFFETAKAVAMDPSVSGIKSLAQQGLSSITNLGSEALDYANKNKLSTALTVANLASLGAQLGMPRNEGEDDASYAKRLQEAQGYVTQYGRNLRITNPSFYQREGAVNPFATTMAANGGIMGYAKGGSMIPPARQIEGGIIELDARKTGGYIPYGKKERVDDVPAMLAKDEFVFTSRAVKAAGDGSARRGAAKMYKLMKQLESKGMKMERGARA